MKKILLFIIVLSVLVSALPIFAAAEDKIEVVINGEQLVSDVPALMVPVYDAGGSYVGDRTMLPLRAISSKLNFDISWDEQTSGITIYRNNQLILMWIGKQTAFLLDGVGMEKAYTMDAPPEITNGRTLVPVRAVAELLGADVSWDGATKTVNISYNIGQIEENEGIAEQCTIYGQLLSLVYNEYESFMNGTLKGRTGKIVLTSGKEMNFVVYPELAHVTAGQFIRLAKEGAYNNTIFHRVIKDFVAQGGGIDGTTGELKTAEKIIGEFVMNGQFNLMPHKRGALSLARPDDPNGGSNQFFICHTDLKHLDGQYAVFGKITDGFDVLDEICNTVTDENDKPVEAVVIKEIIIND